jgi:hypothetical protein
MEILAPEKPKTTTIDKPKRDVEFIVDDASKQNGEIGVAEKGAHEKLVAELKTFSKDMEIRPSRSRLDAKDPNEPIVVTNEVRELIGKDMAGDEIIISPPYNNEYDTEDPPIKSEENTIEL